jgi:GntR family transcriptional regulator/MocR family aminotransferase
MLGIELDRTGGLSLRRQIYQVMKQAMIQGRLAAGEALPSTRELAHALGVSRNTVCEAYDMLIAEGYAESRQGAPTRVVAGLLLDAAERVQESPQTPKRVWKTDFRTGQPELRLFPWPAFVQTLHRCADGLPLSQLGYAGAQGLPELRGEISAWLYRMRGIGAEPKDIFITAGATHALHIAAELLTVFGHHMLVEDPCHSGILQTFLQKGYNVYPVPVDSQGIMTDAPDEHAGAPVYVTPSHQFPLGGILPASRRAALIRYARAHNTYIIEDDYDSEFRYVGEPVAPMVAMDAGRVIYVGTFSKVLYPALRIGYAIVPRPLQDKWKRLRTHIDVQNPSIEQASLAEFMRSRKLDRHVFAMRKAYGRRRQALLNGLTDAFGNSWQPWGDAAGLHLAAAFDGMRFDAAFLEEAKRQGIRIALVDSHCIVKGRHTDKLLLGYGHLTPEEIQSGVERLKALVDAWRVK